MLAARFDRADKSATDASGLIPQNGSNYGLFSERVWARREYG